MDKIASFTVDHTILKKGMYLSRQDGDTVTYDIRTRVPNVEPVMSNAAIHTLEHLFATFVRNSEFSKKIVYFGPMGCRTGFYFITLDSLPAQYAIKLTIDALKFCANFNGEIPGASEAECGNWREHDLLGARAEAEQMIKVLDGWTTEKLKYPQKP